MRRNILLVTLKPHSTLQSHFIGEDIKVNIDSYNDLLDYLIVMQPQFIYYSKQLISEGLQESFIFLDEQLNEIQRDDFFIKRFTSDTTIYIVPTIMGGGGKRGGVLAILAAAALFIFAPQLAPLLGNLTAGAGATAAGAGAGAAAGGGLVAAEAAITQLAIGLAISGLSAILMKAPSAPRNSDSARAENNMFSSLQNTIDSGTFVPINYGMPRVAGHLVTGYIKTINHPKGFKVSVSDVIGFNSALYDSTQAAQSGFLTIPTNISVVVRDGLIMYIDPGNTGSYPVTGTSITDLISGQTGTISGSISLEDFAFKLDGGYIDMGKSYVSADEINNTDRQYSIEFWTKVPDTITSGTMITNTALGVSLARGSGTVTKTVGKDDRLVQQTKYYADFSSINTTDALTNRNMLNSWVHIVYTLADTTLRTYTNGKLKATDTVSTTISGATNLLIGSSGLADSYLGLARLYNKQLSEEEIVKNFNSEKARFETSTSSPVILSTQQVVNNRGPGG